MKESLRHITKGLRRNKCSNFRLGFLFSCKAIKWEYIWIYDYFINAVGKQKYSIKWNSYFCASLKQVILAILLLTGIGLYQSCQNPHQPTLFKLLSAADTGIHFNNTITEDSIHNILNFTNLYTGSGVGIGDFNKDGLPDIFLGGNMETSRLFLNKGHLQFEDITTAASVNTDRWITGVAIADVNADGWQDIYLSVSGKADPQERRNILFLNKGKSVGGLEFIEQAENLGLADTSQCTHANFFDYDKDGDLDVFVVVNPTDYTLYNVNSVKRKKVKGEAASTDRLYRNNLVETGKTSFTDVSKEAGILIEGYSLGLNVSDLNGDHYPDIYITNDFLTNDILYINNQDGTFTNQAKSMLKHTSFASMGIDVADINNDALPDIYVLDMFPEDNYRQKMIMGSGNYDRFQYILKMGYEPQYSRNTLQLNNGDATFSEIGQLAKVHQTDWSWSCLLADYDNDGYKDLYVTNGFRRDLGNLDFINYQNNNAFGDPAARKQQQIESIKEQSGAKLSNYIFKNENGLNFSKQSASWGVDRPSYSHGAAFADLDRDGDLDIVVNNVSQEAFVYENTQAKKHYLQLELEGTRHNTSAFGTKVHLYSGDQIQYAEQNPFRGYQSTVDATLHFGLGDLETIDSLIIQWTNGQVTTIIHPPIDTLLTIAIKKQTKFESSIITNKLVQEKQFISSDLIAYKQIEDHQVDFKTQSLLPHQHSKQGPSIVVGDINGDGLEDCYIGGASGISGVFYIQQLNGSFREQLFDQDIKQEDTACQLLDVDQDGDLDLYVASGGVFFSATMEVYQDRLYINDGMGNFSKQEKALPPMPTSTTSIASADYDQDGDLDLFIGGRVTPGKYPLIPNSYLLENEDGTFKNRTPLTLSKIGMVTSAIWSDYDNDGDGDLVLAGEFMPITIFKNEQGVLQEPPIRIPYSAGWWESLAQGDFDQDGDLDYLAGNLGLNTNYSASISEPLCLYAKDFDKNGSLDPILCQYLQGTEYIIPTRDQLVTQIPPFKMRFNSYKKYAMASFEEVVPGKDKLKGIQILQCQRFESTYIENKGDGSFELHDLSLDLQFAPINDFLIDDFNADGWLDALAVGNSYSTEVGMGYYDAFTGALLEGDGTGKFTTKRGATIGLVADKDAKSITQIRLSTGRNIILVGNNSDSLQLFIQTENIHEL